MPAAVILCAAMLVATTCGPVDSMLLMGGRSMLSLFNTALALSTNVALDLLLVPEYGVSGAAAGWAAGILVNNLLPLWQVNRVMSMHPLGAGTQSAIAISVISFGVVAGGCRILLGGDLVSLLVAGLLGTATFAVLVHRRDGVLELGALRAVVRRGQRR